MAKEIRNFRIPHRISLTVWLMIAVVFLVYLLLVLRLDFSQMLVPCQGTDCNFNAMSIAEINVLDSWGLTTQDYAYYSVTVAVLLTMVYWFLGGLIVWRQGNTRLGLAVSLTLIILPISTYGGSTDWATNYPSLVIPGVFLNILGTVIEIVFFYLVPNGRFSPKWAYIPMLITSLLLIILTLEINGVIVFSDTISTLLGAIIVGMVVLGGTLQIYRYRVESTPLERQQTKWILFGVLTYILSVVIWVLIFGRAMPIPAGNARLLAMMVGGLVINIILLGLPAAITIAILRHRLWDIDLVIRRTLQYVFLTGLLALVYFGGVVVLQWVLSPLIGSDNSPVITVITTLAIAGLFNPLRHRIQEFIDRRFFRKKYDAVHALLQFATTARDEVDVDRLSMELIAVAEETMQPDRVSLWVRKKGQDHA